MSTSDTDRKSARLTEDRGALKTSRKELRAQAKNARRSRRSAAAGAIAFNYTAAAAIVAAAGLIYELFSHGVWSVYMGFGFMVPLALGALPNFIIWLSGAKAPGAAAENIYACGVATLTAGCLLKGVLDIFGTTNHLLNVYPFAGAALLAAGAAIYLFGKKKAEV